MVNFSFPNEVFLVFGTICAFTVFFCLIYCTAKSLTSTFGRSNEPMPPIMSSPVHILPNCAFRTMTSSILYSQSTSPLLIRSPATSFCSNEQEEQVVVLPPLHSYLSVIAEAEVEPPPATPLSPPPRYSEDAPPKYEEWSSGWYVFAIVGFSRT